MPSRTSKPTKERATRATEQPEVTTLASLLDKERRALERGVATLDRVIALVEEMLAKAAESKEDFNDRLSSHLAWLIKGRADSLAKLRQFGEKVKTQSLELTPEQQRRAVFKFIQGQPVTVREECRRLLEEPIEDIELVS